VVLPRQRWVTDIVTSVIVPVLFALVYSGIAVTTFASTPGGFSTLGAVATLFSNPWALLAGWIHYLASICSSARGRSGTRVSAACRICSWCLACC
jgi:hypothetical protein